MIFNHGLSRTGFANARPGRARSPSAPFGRGTSPACPQWLVAVCTFSALVLTAFAADPGITVSARQRYPWNGLVDLHFTITGTSGTKYDTSFTAKDMVGNTNIAMRTIRKADGTAAAAKEQLLPGTYNWVWDAAADLPKDFKCDRVTVTATAGIAPFPYSVKFNANGGTGTMSNESFTYGTAKALTANAFTRTGYTFQGWATSASGAKVYNDKQSVFNLTETSGAVVSLYAVWKSALYMVIDLSSGANSSSYAVSYLDAVPSGGWSDEHKTAKLVLRRIEPGAFTMAGYGSSNTHKVTLTKAYYIGIFEVTQAQYLRVMGVNPSYHVSSGEASPVEYVYWTDLRGAATGIQFPSDTSCDSSSFFGIMRSRTSLSFLDLPTEAQWQYACMGNGTLGGVAESGTTRIVGTKSANGLGLYDMQGNVDEWMIDLWKEYGTGDCIDPEGGTSGTVRIIKGGYYGQTGSDPCNKVGFRCNENQACRHQYTGFRVCMTLRENGI